MERSERAPGAAIALLSNEHLTRRLFWSTVSDPLYREMEHAGACRRIAPPAGLAEQLRTLLRLIREARRCRALFSMNGHIWPKGAMAAASWAAAPAVRACFYIDPWRNLLDRIRTADRLQGNDLVFIPYREAFDELRTGPGGWRYRYLPFAADTRAFRDRGEPRDIDILWMGRRDAALHEAILAHAERAGLVYRYRENTGFIDDADQLGALVARARYFVVTPPTVSRASGYSPLVMRYLEGLAAGCRLVGTLPASGEFEALLPRASLLEVAADGSDFAELYEADQANSAGWDASAQASRIVHAEHGWDSRARHIVEAITALLA